MRNLYFKNSYVSIYYDKEWQLGVAVWQGKLQDAEFREATLLCLDVIDRFELKRWLGDNRKMKSINPSDLQWSTEVFVPQIVESPLLRLANLPSEDEGHTNAVDIMIEKCDGLGQKLEIRDFGSEAEAMAWLLEPLDGG
ncbi:MAG: hypothetical protein LPK14_13815 [Hymenobacteraceae bacterium]|nr:hypothetical protein [Hymenobacteraceae bacterium]